MKLFIDRDLGVKLGRALNAVGIAVTNHVDRYPDADREPDRLWIQVASGKDEVILTRDGKIHRIDVELAAIVESGGRAFILETGNAKPLDYLRAVMAAWPRIIEIVAMEDGPWVYGINRSGRLTKRYPRD